MIPGNTTLAADFTGFMWPTIRRTAPASLPALGWLLCDGTAYSRATYAGLFAYLCPSSTVTITIASPGVVTWTAHPLVNGDAIKITTTGALPTGLTASTKYWVINVSTNTFQLSLTKGGAAINTTGSQSGVHTLRCVTIGDGDGSTTFNVPDMRNRAFIGAGSGTKVISLPATAISSNQITVGQNSDLNQGQAVLLTGSSITGLVTLTTYYVIIIDSTHIKLASSQANANTGTPLTISGTPSGDTLTIAFTPRFMGDTGGEDTHGIAAAEGPSHAHNIPEQTAGGASARALQALATTFSQTQTSLLSAFSGVIGTSDTQHNNMMPFFAGYWWIHI